MSILKKRPVSPYKCLGCDQEVCSCPNQQASSSPIIILDESYAVAPKRARGTKWEVESATRVRLFHPDCPKEGRVFDFQPLDNDTPSFSDHCYHHFVAALTNLRASVGLPISMCYGTRGDHQYTAARCVKIDWVYAGRDTWNVTLVTCPMHADIRDSTKWRVYEQKRMKSWDTRLDSVDQDTRAGHHFHFEAVLPKNLMPTASHAQHAITQAIADKKLDEVKAQAKAEWDVLTANQELLIIAKADYRKKYGSWFSVHGSFVDE